MAFIENPDGNPFISRGERAVRYGSLLPILGCFLVILSTDVVTYSRLQYFAAAMAFVLTGQALVWVGMHFLRRGDGWDSGILYYLWAGGVMTTIATYGTALAVYNAIVFPPALIPWIPPVVATVAKRRLLRRRGVGAGVGA
ncbi:hypothetical protein ABZ832_21230 [Streptantibioticus parmotrematis]|uniref:hypothetical protein n=1 Tax=Streptantibioticus parmotrematis TaxID=2873249 RepID=UPI0033E28105